MPEFKLQDAIDELVETAKNFTIIPTLLNRTKQGYKEKMLELKSRDEVSVKEAQELYNMSLLVESAEKNIADGKSNYEKYKNEIISYLKTMPGITITSDKNRHQSKN